PGQLDHALRLVDSDDLCSELVPDPLRQLPAAGADLEHTPRLRLGDRLERHLPRVRAGSELLRGDAGGEAGLVGVVPPDDLGIIEAHGSTIGWPASLRDCDFPPSHRLTDAPTSANSPSWMRPPAFFPCT